MQVSSSINPKPYITKGCSARMPPRPTSTALDTGIPKHTSPTYSYTCVSGVGNGSFHLHFALDTALINMYPPKSYVNYIKLNWILPSSFLETMPKSAKMQFWTIYSSTCSCTSAQLLLGCKSTELRGKQRRTKKKCTRAASIGTHSFIPE